MHYELYEYGADFKGPVERTTGTLLFVHFVFFFLFTVVSIDYGSTYFVHNRRRIRERGDGNRK